METSLINRLQATLLAVATVALVILAVLNFRQESSFRQPTDGVWWSEAPSGNGLLAEKVLPDSPGQRAGIQPHDLLTGVNDTHVAHLSDLERELYRTGVYVKANYTITRDGIPLETPVVVIPEPLDRSLRRPSASSASSIWPSASMCSSAAGPLRAPPISISSAWSRSPSYASSTPASWTLLDWTVFWLNVARRGAAAGALPAFRAQLPRRAAQEHPPPLAVAAGLRARRGPVRPVGVGHQHWRGHRPAEARLDQAGTAYDAAFYVLAACSSCAATAAPTRPCCASS